MSVRVTEQLRRSLSADAEILERESITIWLMRFASGLPLKLHHPVMGDISFSGIRFSGSVIPVFDRYVSLTVEDLIEKHLTELEKILAEVSPNEVQSVGLAAAAMLNGTRQRLLAKAAAIKARLLNAQDAEAVGVSISAVGAHHVSVAARIDARISELRDRMPPTPKWGWLETFAKTNPILSKVISYGLATLVGVAITLILGKR
ncbi:MAG: hypothetical protein V4527_15005 [Pseudomonadota bacterium]